MPPICTKPREQDTEYVSPDADRRLIRVSLRVQKLDDDTFFGRNVFKLIFASLLVETFAILMVSWCCASGLVLILLSPVFDSFITTAIAYRRTSSKELILSRMVRFLELLVFVLIMYANFVSTTEQRNFFVAVIPELRPMVESPYLDSYLLMAATWLCIYLNMNYKATEVIRTQRIRRSVLPTNKAETHMLVRV